MEGAPSTIVEVMRHQVRELSHVIQTDWFATDSLKDMVIDLQKDWMPPCSTLLVLQFHLPVTLSSDFGQTDE